MGACKKDSSGSSSGKLLLSKIFLKGLLLTEYIYDTEGRLVRNNNYLTGSGQSTLSTYRLYEYNDEGKLYQVWHFTKEYTPTVRRIFSYDAQGRLSRVDEATIFTGDDNLDHMDYFEVYNYNASGQLTTETRRFTNYTMHRRSDYTYDDKGNLATEEVWYMDNGSMVLKQKTEINAGAKPMPEHWKALALTPTDMGLYEFFITGKKYTSYYSSPAGDVSNWSYLDRQYNSQGYVVKETWQVESFGSTNASERTFEYVQ
jgi:hypothetical protein